MTPVVETQLHEIHREAQGVSEQVGRHKMDGLQP
jgi:hypothetical protein